jgi:hypothetical protein
LRRSLIATQGGRDAEIVGDSVRVIAGRTGLRFG